MQKILSEQPWNRFVRLSWPLVSLDSWFFPVQIVVTIRLWWPVKWRGRRWRQTQCLHSSWTRRWQILHHLQGGGKGTWMEQKKFIKRQLGFQFRTERIKYCHQRKKQLWGFFFPFQKIKKPIEVHLRKIGSNWIDVFPHFFLGLRKPMQPKINSQFQTGISTFWVKTHSRIFTGWLLWREEILFAPFYIPS